MSTVGANSIAAARAWNQSLTDYGNFIDSSMRQFGWTMPNAEGQYSVQSAQSAFDPQTMIQFGEDGRPSFDAASLARMGAAGQYGTTGLFAETTQMGAEREAEARLEARQRGIRGGLASQQERLAETLAGRELGDVSRSMFEGLVQGFGGIQRSYEDVLSAEQLDRIAAAQAASAEISPLGDPVAPPPVVEEPVVAAGPSVTVGGSQFTAGQQVGAGASGIGSFTKKQQPGGSPPKNPKPREVYRGPGGVWFAWRPSGPQGAGWYRKA